MNETAEALTEAGKRAYQNGNYGKARRLHEQSLVLRRALGDQKGSAASLNNMGNAAYQQGDLQAAQRFHRQSLEIKEAIGERRGMAGSLNNLGLVALKQSDFAAARRLLHESLVTYREVGDPKNGINPLENVAYAALSQNDAPKAVVLLGAASALREIWDAPLPPLDKAEQDDYVAQARLLLVASGGDEAFSAAWERGRVMDWEQAVDYALTPLNLV